MQLSSISVLFFVTILSGVALSSNSTRTKRVMYAMCPPNFIGIGSLCYYISNYPVSWLEAQFECKDKNSKLAEPIKLADKKLRRYLQEYDKDHNDLWIGGTFDWQTNKWTWGYSGKDVTYNSFGQLDLENKRHIPYHCAVLDPYIKYRWSARSCVDQHRFICQHKMPRVSDKNRAKIYNRWNATYPNQMANEIILELTPDNYRRNPDGQRRRRMRPYNTDKISNTVSYPILRNFDNNINVDYKTNNPILDPVTEYVTNGNRINNNNNDDNVFNYEVRKYHRRRRPLKNPNTTPSNDINETIMVTPRPKSRQRSAFDLEIEEKRRQAREKRRQERRRQKQLEREQRQREIQEQELELLRKQQLAEEERERKQNEIDQRRIKEIEEQKRLKEMEEIEHRRITEERERQQKEHEQQLEEKKRQHEEWRNNFDEQEKKDQEKQEEIERQNMIKQQEEEFKKMLAEREAEDRRRMEEELVRLEMESKLREERQKAREEELKKREEILKQEEEEERRIQEELKKREEQERKAREEDELRKKEEQRKKEEERKQKEQDELRKIAEREEKQRQKKLKRIKAQEEELNKNNNNNSNTDKDKTIDEKQMRQKEFRERLAKLSPEEQIIFFKRREERNKRKRLSNKGENEVITDA